jgi:hypothetical protein
LAQPDALADELEARADALAQRAVEAMYRDPFWDARFGSRGRAFALEDNRHHVSYLVQALRAGSPELLVNYGRWLQSVLTTRGMCSRHLDDNFLILSETIEAEGIAEAARARDYLDEARRGLRYTAGAARELQVATEAIANRAAARGGRAEELLHYLSYLADALALGRDDLFAAHIRWVSERNDPGQVRSALESLGEALDALQPADRDAARAVVDAGLTALDSGPEQRG